MLLLALAITAAGPARLPACQTNQLSLAFDGEGGAFNGMSQSGTLLVLRNIGPAACSVPGLPRLGFKDAAGKPLPITRKAPIGMHPGPVVLPVGIAPDAEVTAKLHWVSGPVFDHNICLSPRFATVTIGGETIQSALGARICGSGAVTFDQPVLRPDPRLE